MRADAVASTTSHPAFVTTRDRPSCRNGMAGIGHLIWGFGKTEFCPSCQFVAARQRVARCPGPPSRRNRWVRFLDYEIFAHMALPRRSEMCWDEHLTVEWARLEFQTTLAAAQMVERNPRYDGLHVYKIDVAKLMPGDVLLTRNVETSSSKGKLQSSTIMKATLDYGVDYGDSAFNSDASTEASGVNHCTVTVITVAVVIQGARDSGG
jgi:hypothetical protein